ncbi:MAG: [FeFe] hydrogenase H-cluster radical SAM maturase HydE [Planctomycetes bacterium]|nr:[FeFe] hydrogenase H-cluster radical SAM maturase HydE [Planctomycetota bacterium]
MCYAIPGKIIELNDRTATVDYYGEQKKAYTDLLEVQIGDYVYAQGGFLIQKVPPKEAHDILSDWEELFFKLQEKDKKLSAHPKNLYERANAIRQQNQGNSCCVHGILEFSNYCRQNCLYCGIRRDNKELTRYRLEIPQILESVKYAYDLGFKALVLQSGEDPYYDDDKLETIVKTIREKYPVLLFVSIGERSLSAYRRLYDAGARGVLMRFETCNPDAYKKVKPDSDLQNRLQLIRDLRKMGYLIVTGFLVGLPGEDKKDILENIKLTASLDAEMFSFGPFIPHPQTPLAETPMPKLTKLLRVIAEARLMNPESRILVTTALETLDQDAARQGLLAGANSLMINVTPPKYRKLYDIYPQRFGTDLDTQEHIDRVIGLLKSLGRAPTDLSV